MISFKCMAGELARALNLCAQVSGREKQLPILRATRVEVANGAATFSATNLDHCVSVKVAAEGEGIAYIVTELLRQKASVLRPNEIVTLKSDDGKTLLVKQGAKTNWKTPLLDGAGFPDKFISPVPGKPVTANRLEFFGALAMAKEAIRSSIAATYDSGALIDVADGDFVVIGTDRKRLAMIRPTVPPLANNIIMPNEAMAVASSVFRDADEVQLVADEKAIQIEADGVFYKTKLIEGNYGLDWRMAMKTLDALDASVLVDRQAFSEAMGRAAAIAADVTQAGGMVSMRLEFGGGECVFTCTNKSGEEGTDACEAIGDDPEYAGHISVSEQGLGSMVKTITSDRMMIWFSTGETPAPLKLTPYPEDLSAGLRVVMPLRG